MWFVYLNVPDGIYTYLILSACTFYWVSSYFDFRESQVELLLPVAGEATATDNSGLKQFSFGKSQIPRYFPHHC